MQGICNRCACVCVLDEIWEQYGCPACRAARAVNVLNESAPLYTELHETVSRHYLADDILEQPIQTEVPRGCKMPLGDAAQIYELRRMFRL